MNNDKQKTRRSRTKVEIKNDIYWGREAAKIIRAAMARKGVQAPVLAEMLTEQGRPTEAQALRNLLSRGNFKAAWFLEVLNLLEQTDIKIK